MERKSWRLWIVVMIAMMLVCLAASAVTAEETITATTEPVTVSVKGGLTNEEAAEGYIRNLFQIPTETKGRNLRGVSAGSLLKGKEAIVYSILKEKIEEVARGEQPNTVFSIPVKSIYTENTHYTAEDLGLTILVENNDITDEALNAFYEKISIDYKKVMDALLFDCPYDLYWFDKTEGYLFDSPYCTTNSQDTEIFLWNYDKSEIDFCFYVSKDYSASEETGTSVCKTSYGQNAVAAAENAQQIVNDNAGKSDRQKLTAYKDAICERTSYNSAAAASHPPYGDPWQLVWVFDNDTTTTVVCEGYSKAFQYLCDLSHWDSGLEVISVSGTMTGGTGAGGHMWNIVSMGDGKNYMADITNSDAGSAGWNGGLFLNGYKSKSDDNKQYVFDAGNQEINYTYGSGTLQTYGATGKLVLAGTEAPYGLSVSNEQSSLGLFDTGVIEYDARYINSQGGVEGVTLTAEVYRKGSENTLYSDTTLTYTGTFRFEIWEDGNYELDVTAMKGTEILDSCIESFTVTAGNGYHYFDPQIPRYWQIPLSGAPYQLTLNYGEDALKPDKVDVYVYDDETGEAVINETGIDPDTVLECPIKKGDCFNVRVTNYKQGYRASTYNMYNCKAVFGTLGAPTAIVPTSAAAGEPINITIDEVTNANYYRAEITGTTVNYYANRRINQAGAYTIEEFGLDSGEYKILLTAEAYFDYAVSPATEYTLTVAGERPPVPTVTEPEGPFAAGSIAWYTLTGEGLTAVCRNYSGDVYQAQNGTAMVPVEAYGWKRNFSFRGLYNGRWSHATDEFELTGQAETKPEVEGPTLTLNPETPLRGQNLRVEVTPVEGATHYAFSFGLHLTYDEDDIHEDFMDQIIYDEPFEISDGGVTIHGCNLIQAGEYSVTVTAYSDLYGGTLCETTRHFTVGENPNIPAAPNVTLLTTENLLFGTSQFQIDIPDGGADRVYAFISRQDDYGLEENPIEEAIDDPNATSYTFKWQSLKVGTYEAYFAISRIGTWSDSPEPLVFDVKTTSEEELCEGKKLNYPAEAEIGDTVTISWDAISEAEWFEAYAEVNDDTLYDGKPAKGATTIDIDTTNAKNSGNLDFELWAYAPGYYRSSIYTDPEIMLLDPRLKITAMLTQALDSANIVTLHLTNVQANRIRVKIDGEVVGMYGLGPNDGTADLTIMVPRRDSQIQVANYDTDPRKWGSWSDPVTANSVIVDPTKILYLPEDLTRIEANAFEGIDAEAIVVPAGCEYIGDRAFANCPNLVYVSYPESATLAGDPFAGSNVKTYNVYEVQQD